MATTAMPAFGGKTLQSGNAEDYFGEGEPQVEDRKYRHNSLISYSEEKKQPPTGFPVSGRFAI